MQPPFTHNRFNPAIIEKNIGSKVHVDTHGITMLFEDTDHVGVVNHDRTFFLVLFSGDDYIMTEDYYKVNSES